MSQYREQRLSEAYLHALASLLVTELTDPALKGVYITRVKFTRDLSLADVYFATVDGREQEEAAKQAFLDSKGLIRRELAHKVNMKYTPDLRFFYDDTEELQQKIDNLIRKIDHEPENKDEED